MRFTPTAVSSTSFPSRHAFFRLYCRSNEHRGFGSTFENRFELRRRENRRCLQRRSNASIHARPIHFRVRRMFVASTKQIFRFSEYTNRLVEEINDILSERGLMSMSDLIRQFDLPTDYLQTLVHQRIIGSSSTTTNVKFESSTLYTENYVRLQQNILIGYLQAALLPVRVNELLRQSRMNENLIQSKRRNAKANFLELFELQI